MWSGTTWHQWPLQPSMYQNVPHEEIDWAALAKQWIQLHQVNQEDSPDGSGGGGGGNGPHGSGSLHPIPPHIHSSVEQPVGSNSGPPLLPSHCDSSMAPSSTSMASNVSEGSGEMALRDEESNSGFVTDEVMGGGYWGSSGWDVNMPGAWVAPSSGAVSSQPIGKETFDYGHVHGNQPLTAQSFDYNHGSDQYAYNQMYVPDSGQYDQYWSQVNSSATPVSPVVAPSVPVVPPPFLKKAKVTGDRSPHSEEDGTHLAGVSFLDAAKRKQLPAWIREGLEKMERERQKKLEKERTERERKELLIAKKEAERSQKALDVKKTDSDDESSAPEKPVRSKFESDSEDEDDDPRNENPVSSPERFVRSPTPEDTRTEEERHRELMLRVRRMLTEILLDVTNEEIFSVAKEVHRRALSKAPARQLASSSALASIASGLGGLAGYGSDSEDSASGGDGDSDFFDSDEELYHSIREKKKAFAEKEKRIMAELEREEALERERRERLRKEEELKKLELKKEQEKSSQIGFIRPSPGSDENPVSEENDPSPTTEVKQEDNEIKVEPGDHPEVSPENVENRIQKEEAEVDKNEVHDSPDADAESDGGSHSSHALSEGNIKEEIEEEKNEKLEESEVQENLDKEVRVGEIEEGLGGREEEEEDEDDDDDVENEERVADEEEINKAYDSSEATREDIREEELQAGLTSPRSRSSSREYRHNEEREMQRSTSRERKKHKSRKKKRNRSYDRGDQSSSRSISRESCQSRSNSSEYSYIRRSRSRSDSRGRHSRRHSRSFSRERSGRRNGRHRSRRSHSRSIIHVKPRRDSSYSRRREKEKYSSGMERKKAKYVKYSRSRSNSIGKFRSRKKKRHSRSQSRSRSRTPRKYRRRTSRSLSSESMGSGRKSSGKHKYR